MNVTNEGDGAGTQDITYDLENDAGISQLSDSQEVQLDAGASQEITFEVAASDTQSLSTGNYTHVFSSDDDELTVDATVVEQDTTLGDLAVNVAPSTVTANESTDVTVTVTNQTSGDAVEGASVSISDLGLSATTDADGNATLSVNASAAGDYPIDVSADGFTDASATLTVVDAGEVPTDPNERALAIAGVDDPANLTQDDVTAAITRFERGEPVDNIDIEQDDVTAIITLFERN